MTSDELVFSTLSALGLPIVNLARTGSINESPRVSTPFLMFGVDGGGEMYADDSVWAEIPIALETVAEALEALKSLPVTDSDIVTAMIGESKEIGRYHMMMGQNPVYVISCTGKGEEDE